MLLRRWPLRSKVLAVLALVAAAASFGLVQGYAAEIEALRPSTGDPVPVVVAARGIERGTVLVEDALRVERIPSEYAPPGAIDAVEDAVGQTLVSDLAEGEPVTKTRVAAGGGPVASRVASGLRAFVVTTGIPAGVLEPGDLVDVIATFGGPRPYTETVGTALEVLSIIEEGTGTFEAAGASGPSLVLLVSPETAERLAYATAFASIAVTVAPFDAAI